jgi:hypothetical protein
VETPFFFAIVNILRAYNTDDLRKLVEFLDIKVMPTYFDRMGVIHRIVHDMIEEPPAGGVLEVGVVMGTLCGVVGRSAAKALRDTLAVSVLRVAVAGFEVKFWVGWHAHGRKLVFAVNHIMQRMREADSADAVRDNVHYCLHAFVAFAAGLFPCDKRKGIQVILVKLKHKTPP